MRDQLDDIQKHLDAGYGRAQHLNNVELPKRFYKETGVPRLMAASPSPLTAARRKSPGHKMPVVVPAAGIATAMANEWAAQGEHIDPAIMPTVRLINSALESGEAMIPAFRDEVIKFAGGDLMLYRAETPKDLVADQEAVWDQAWSPWRDISASASSPLSASSTSPSRRRPWHAWPISQGEGLLTLTAMVSITGLTGSGLLTIGLWNKLFTPDHVWLAAHVDEDFQIRLWGEDEEASERRA